MSNLIRWLLRSQLGCQKDDIVSFAAFSLHPQLSPLRWYSERQHTLCVSISMRVTLRDGKLICVSVETWTPKASVVVLEWFRPEMSPEFYLRYVKAAIPTARVDFPSSLPDAEKKRAFDVSTSCLLIPRLCATTEDLLPLVRTLRLRTTPDPPKLAFWPIFSHIYLSRPLGYLIVLGIALSLAVCLLSAHMKRRTRRH